MEILAVCGFSVGGSMVLEVSLDKVIKELSLKTTVENTGLPITKATTTDVYSINHELLPELKVSVKTPAYPIKKYMDTSKIKAQLERYLVDKGE